MAQQDSDQHASDHERLEASLTNHSVSDEVGNDIEAIREEAKTYGHEIIELLPPSRERSLALTKLEESVMWAVKACVLSNK